MCGLAGFARNPNAGDSDGLALSKIIFEELMARAEKRGRHATGFSVHDTAGAGFLSKIAMPATAVMKLPRWTDGMARVTESTAIVIGHTRHATQNNAKRDDCAHPFQFGDITGAHNGMIYNWKPLAQGAKHKPRWDVDSEAIFDLMARAKKPATVLNKLEGYWALTWQKRGRLMVCKTADAQFAMAYVPALRTLFWHSVKSELEAVLKQTALVYEAWELVPNRINTYDPTQFDASGTHVMREDVAFTASKGKRYDTSATDERALMRGPSPAAKASWRTTDDVLRDARLPHTQIDVEVATLRAMMLAMQRDMEGLHGKIGALTDEVAHLRGICDDAGLLDMTGDCIECEQPGATVRHPDGFIHPDCILPTTPYKPDDRQLLLGPGVVA